MDYKTISQLRTSSLEPEALPFTKRAAFADEKEYRIVFRSKRQTLSTKRIPVPITTVNRIDINPWVAEPLFNAIKDTIATIPGCEKMVVYQSKLIDSPSWKAFAGEYA